MPNTPEDYAAFFGAMFTFLLLIGLLYKYVLEPNLDKRFARIEQPIVETHEQLLKNGGKNEPPTVPDNFHAVHESLGALQTSVDLLAKQDETHTKTQALMQANLSAIVLVLDEHLRWSRDYVAAQEAGQTRRPFGEYADADGED